MVEKKLEGRWCKALRASPIEKVNGKGEAEKATEACTALFLKFQSQFIHDVVRNHNVVGNWGGFRNYLTVAIVYFA